MATNCVDHLLYGHYACAKFMKHRTILGLLLSGVHLSIDIYGFSTLAYYVHLRCIYKRVQSMNLAGIDIYFYDFTNNYWLRQHLAILHLGAICFDSYLYVLVTKYLK